MWKQNYKSVIIYDEQTNNYTSSAPLKNDRIRAACTLIKESPGHNNRPIVLVAGGNSQNTAEVYDYTQPNASWQPSKHNHLFFVSLSLTSVQKAKFVFQKTNDFLIVSFQLPAFRPLMILTSMVQQL